MRNRRNSKLVAFLCVAVVLLTLYIFGLHAGFISLYGPWQSTTNTTGGNGGMQYENGVAQHGQLRVQGPDIVNEQGEVVQLRGMSSHGLAWYPAYINVRSMQTLRSAGANLFRAAMYADDDNAGYNSGSQNRRVSKGLLMIAVENALYMDMYVIVDWHIYEDNNPLTHLEEAMAFFDEISALYADEPGVIYEICNEPNGDTTWEDIREYAQAVIPVIRNNAPNALIIVGTPDYSSAITDVLHAPLTQENILYTYHLYTGLSHGNFARAINKVRDAGLAVFVSEWGISTDEETGELDLQEAYDFIAYMKEKNISWANWSLSNKDEDHAAIKPEVTKLHSWAQGDLTVPGQIIFDALAGN